MKLNNKTQIILGLLLIAISSVMLWYTMREKAYWGTVTDKINALEYNKHVSHPDPILIVRFDVNKKKRELHVSWITYTECEVNERVCFTEPIMVMEPTWIEPGLLALIACAIIVTGIVFVLNGLEIFDIPKSSIHDF
jgi:hypothetical protein